MGRKYQELNTLDQTTMAPFRVIKGSIEFGSQVGGYVIILVFLFILSVLFQQFLLKPHWWILYAYLFFVTWLMFRCLHLTNLSGCKNLLTHTDSSFWLWTEWGMHGQPPPPPPPPPPDQPWIPPGSGPMDVVNPSEDSNSQDSVEFNTEAHHGVYPPNSHGYGAQPDNYAMAPMAMNQFDYQVCRCYSRNCWRVWVLVWQPSNTRRRKPCKTVPASLLSWCDAEKSLGLLRSQHGLLLI